MPSWGDHDNDCPRRHPQTDEFRCTCGTDTEAVDRRRLAELARERRQLEAELANQALRNKLHEVPLP
jgi:hypothetical protein